ncbi:hypothetical protein F2Q69_00020162 [Brassica cretica]|uniref:Uncharacterized protein n=1 Tax=Brassica cretica TaxID=69181 RepID=A0A8S9QBI5_BRACR|nr:hypothetical protein F2Q69_00020162 [Brassica cretica]
MSLGEYDFLSFLYSSFTFVYFFNIAFILSFMSVRFSVFTRDTKVWLDNWLLDSVPGPPNYRQDSVVDLTLTINDLIDERSNSWNIGLIRQIIAEEDIDLGPETICHMLFHCSTAKEVWRSLNFPLPAAGWSPNSVFLNIHYLISCSQKQSIGSSVRLAFPWVLWQIWKARNKFFFEQVRTEASDIASLAMSEASMWLNLNGHMAGSMEMSQPVSGTKAAEVLNYPLAFPVSYRDCYEVFCKVQAIARSSLHLIPELSNSAASAIALSVTRDHRHHSYAAANGPRWLSSLLSSEANSHY